jgi:hypothetical protein
MTWRFILSIALAAMAAAGAGATAGWIACDCRNARDINAIVTGLHLGHLKTCTLCRQPFIRPDKFHQHG